MKRVLCAIAALVVVCVLPGTAPRALADQGEEITRFEVVADVDKNGTFTVTQTIDYQFTYPGHGIYAWYVTRQGFNDDQDRLITFSNFSATSPTGAPTNLSRDTGSNHIVIRIGDPDRTVSGLQTYVLTYKVTGIVNPEVAETGMDEIYWNVIGTNWEVPIRNVTITINSPAAVSQTTCYTGANYTNPCSAHSSEGSSATWKQDSLNPGSGMAVVGGWPAKTFPGATINVVPKTQSPFDVGSTSGKAAAGGSGVLTAIVAWVLTRFTKKGRDQQYAGVIPGMLPEPGVDVAIKYEEVKDAAVAFAPPEGIPPRLVSAIVREGVDDVDITASIIDLAVRGYLHFDQGQGKDFTLTPAQGSRQELSDVDQRIYDNLMTKGRPITREQMANQEFYSNYQDMKAIVQKEFDTQQWYKTNPKIVVGGYRMLGAIVATGGPALAMFVATKLGSMGIPGFGWIAIPLALLGIGIMAVAKRMPVRTPLGSAIAIQSFGFKKYLETAEATQIKWEEGQDIFSQYLPYAIGFGCAERWAKIFEELVAMGAPVPQPTWYTGYAGSRRPVWSSIDQSVSGIGSSMSESVRANAVAQAMTSGGSSGGSGFSGGGFGGGVGGGGGGRW